MFHLALWFFNQINYYVINKKLLFLYSIFRFVLLKINYFLFHFQECSQSFLLQNYLNWELFSLELPHSSNLLFYWSFFWTSHCYLINDSTIKTDWELKSNTAMESENHSQITPSRWYRQRRWFYSSLCESSRKFSQLSYSIYWIST